MRIEGTTTPSLTKSSLSLQEILYIYAPGMIGDLVCVVQ